MRRCRGPPRVQCRVAGCGALPPSTLPLRHIPASRSVIAAEQIGLILEPVYNCAPERRSTPLAPPPPSPCGGRRSAGRLPEHGARCGPPSRRPRPTIPLRRKGRYDACPPTTLSVPPINFLAVSQIQHVNSAGYTVDAASTTDFATCVPGQPHTCLFLGRPWMRDSPSTPNLWQSYGSC